MASTKPDTTRCSRPWASGLAALCALLATLLPMILLCPIVSATPPTAILLDDFEDGVADWKTNDSIVAGSGRVATLCGIYAAGFAPPGGGVQGAMLDFLPATDAWASVSLPVNGRQWRESQVGQISLWAKATTPDVPVRVTLRVQVPVADGKIEDRSYSQQLKLTDDKWHHIALRFFGFRTDDGTPLDDEALSDIYLLQFVKTGTWNRVRFYVDQIEVRPLGYGQGQPPAHDRPDETVVDFRQNIGRGLAQIGFNLAPDAPVIGTDERLIKAISTLTADLTPCVGRLRLADYYLPDEGQFDIARLNNNINWLLGVGVRPLICLDVPAEVPESTNTEHLRSLFDSTCIKLAELGRGTQRSPYYELFEAPMRERFRDVNELVSEYNRLAEDLQAADPTAQVGAPGFARTDQWLTKEFVGGADSLHFLSYCLRLEGPTWPDDPRLAAAALHGVPPAEDAWGYEQIARHLGATGKRPELFITDWGINRAPAPDSTAAADQEAADAVFLVTSALSATRYADKLLWTQLIDATSGLLTPEGHPRPAYWAAWLVKTYAPRGASCRAYIPCSGGILIAAVVTEHAGNVFVVNRSPWPTAVTFRVVGLPRPEIVRERKLDLAEANTVQHHNLSLSTTQRVKFEGPGVSVIQFINLATSLSGER